MAFSLSRLAASVGTGGLLPAQSTPTSIPSPHGSSAYQASAALLPEGTHAVPIGARLCGSPVPVSGADDGPPLIRDREMKMNPAWAETTRQCELDDFPPEVREQIKEIADNTYFYGRFEYMSMGIQIGDELFIGNNGLMTSNQATGVGVEGAIKTAEGTEVNLVESEMNGVLGRVKKALRQNPKLCHEPITLFVFHTHPDSPDGKIRPVFIHRDERPYTYLSDGDYQDDEGDNENFFEDLRDQGCTGKITMRLGAVPISLSYVPGREMEKAFYVATYTLQDDPVDKESA
jgi:hypothetical protein